MSYFSFAGLSFTIGRFFGLLRKLGNVLNRFSILRIAKQIVSTYFAQINNIAGFLVSNSVTI